MRRLLTLACAVALWLSPSTPHGASTHPSTQSPAATPAGAPALESYVFVRNLGKPGTGDGEFDYPYDVAVLDDRLYVADSNNNRIQVFDLAGQYLFQWGGTGSGDGQFRRNRGIASTPFSGASALIFATDAKNDRVQEFDPQGTHLATFGSIGQDSLQFFRPRGIDVAPDGTVVIGDADNHRMKTYHPDLTLRAIWGERGSALGQFVSPVDCCVSTTGIVYVADTFNNRIQAFTLDGAFVSAFGDSGTAPGQLWDPKAVRTDAAGDLFVAEAGNDRVQKFTSDGTLLAVFGGPGRGPGQLDFPVGLAVDAQGRVYVADSNNHRIAIWSRAAVPLPVRSMSAFKRGFGG